MYNITLISTHHAEIGKCNSGELYKIIESINPEVIFLELPTKLFEKLFNLFETFDSENLIHEVPLEIKVIKKYKQNHSIKIFPVDIDPSPNSLNGEINRMFDKFKQFNSYMELENEQVLLTKNEGFSFLNSKKCSELIDKKKNEETKLMEFGINNMKLLLPKYKLFYDEVENRDNAMVQNIYKYSQENQYNQAVFLIGAGHRNSIIQKVQVYEKINQIKLNWTFYTS